MKIGVQLYTLRKYGQTLEDLSTLFENTAKMGYTIIQYSGLMAIENEETAKKVKELADKNHLHICLTHTPIPRIFNETEAVAKEHVLMECPTCGVGWLPPEHRNSLENLLAFCDNMNKASQVLKKYGLRLAYHNHDFEFSYLEDKKIIDILLEKLNPEIVFTLDTYWIKYANEDVLYWMEKCKGRMVDLHIKDWTDDLNEEEKAEGKKAEMKAIGEGKLDFATILKTAEALGIKNALIELDNAKEPYEAVLSSTNYLKKITPEYFN